MECKHPCASLDVLLGVLVGRGYHQVYVEELGCMLLERLYDWQSESHVGDEHSVHNVDVYPVGLARLDFVRLALDVGVVAREYRRRYYHCLVHAVGVARRPVALSKAFACEYVVDLSEKPEIEPERIKPIAGIAAGENSADERMINLAWWIKEQFGGTMNRALKTVIPSAKKVRQAETRTITAAVSREMLISICAEAGKKHHTAKERFLKELIESGTLDYNLTVGKLNISSATIKKFEADGVIKIISEVRYRNPF